MAEQNAGWLGRGQPKLRDVYNEVRAVRREVLHLQELIMSQQAQLNADAVAIQAIATNLQTATSAIEAEIAALQAANPPLDLTALSAAVATLTPVAAAVAAIPPAASVQAFDPASNLPLYTYAGTPPAPGAPWLAVTDVTGPAGLVLYTNSGDVAGAAPAFVVAGLWPAYLGPLTP